MDKDYKLGFIVSFMVVTVFSFLFIFYGMPAMYGSCWGGPCGISCVSSPINELTTKILDAQTGLITRTEMICFDRGESIGVEAIANKLNGVEASDLSFYCDNSVVCSGDLPIKVTSSEIFAELDAQFKVVIDCDELSEGGYSCEMGIKNS
jgi:hypothetical protein